MRIIYFSSYYDKYLEEFYRQRPLLATKSFDEQICQLSSDYFGVYGSYTKYAKKQNHESFLIVSNCKPAQQMWARENNVSFNEKNWKFSIPLEQVKKIKPDVFFMSSIFEYYGQFLDEIKKIVPKVFGWIACPIPQGVNLRQMDLILTSLFPFVENFRKMGVNSELLPAAFDTAILKEFPSDLKRDIDFSFIGSLSRSHLRRIELIEKLIEKTPLKLFGIGMKLIPDKRSFLKRMMSPSLAEQRYEGEAWGLNMYRALRRSKITFNAHIDVSGDFAGNMRMYEATGMGALVLTDGKVDKNKTFSEDEVVYYDSIDDAVDKVNYYLSNEDELIAVANKGQQATITKYNFEANTIRMLEHFKKYS